MTGLEQLAVLHGRNDNIWADFFISCREKISTDPAFGCHYLMTAWGGMYSYPEQGKLDHEADEQLRQKTANEIYELAREIKNDRN